MGESCGSMGGRILFLSGGLSEFLFEEVCQCGLTDFL